MSMDEEMLHPSSKEDDAPLSSSWPRAEGIFGRPEPPCPPMRKPSDADWDVPPLQLPNKKRTGGASVDDTSTSAAVDDVQADMDADDDEQGVFQFELGNKEDGDWTPEPEVKFVAFDVIGLERDSPLSPGLHPGLQALSASPCAGQSFEGGFAAKRGRSQSVCSSLGASPVLLSALERVAAGAGISPGRRARNRFETVG